MAKITINKKTNYTTIDNNIFKNKKNPHFKRIMSHTDSKWVAKRLFGLRSAISTIKI